MTEEDIKNVIKTLRMIKEECEIHTSCKDCIFSNRGMCAVQLTSIPETWAIKEKVTCFTAPTSPYKGGK